MKYTKVGDFYRVSRVTGPSHNLLGLHLAHAEPAEVVVERLREPEASPLMNEAQLKQAVIEGVNQANASLGTHYYVVAIQYIPSDTPNIETYSFLARSLVEQFVHAGEPTSSQA
jgi:hypothetical protein